MLIQDRFEDLILSNVHFFIRCEGHNAMMIQGRKASLGFITHNFSNEKGERVNALKKKLRHTTLKRSLIPIFCPHER